MMSMLSRWEERVVWVLFFSAVALTVLAIPLCYANGRIRRIVQELAPRSESGHAASVLAGEINAPDISPAAKVNKAVVRFAARLMESNLISLLTSDRSTATIICLALFFSVRLRFLENQRRLSALTRAATDNGARPPAGDPLWTRIGKVRAKKMKLEAFGAELYHEMRLDQYESYLVALGLVGTLMAFLIGFREHLSMGVSYVSLAQTTRDLLVVVGTAVISSVAGIILGMFFVNAMGGEMDRQVDKLYHSIITPEEGDGGQQEAAQ